MEILGKLNILMGLTIAENKTDIGEFNTLIGHGAAKYLNSGDGNTGYGYASLNKVSLELII